MKARKKNGALPSINAEALIVESSRIQSAPSTLGHLIADGAAARVSPSTLKALFVDGAMSNGDIRHA